MNKHRVAFVAISLLLLIGLVVYIWPRTNPKSAPLAAAAQATPPAPITQAMPSLTPQTRIGGLPTPVAPQLARPNEPVKNEPDTNQQQTYLTAFLTPISFWGRVVDENGKPISDALAKLGANDNPNPMEGGSEYVRKTDQNGLFSITGIHGVALSVEVSKQGYYSTKQSNGLVSYVVKGKSDIPVPTVEGPAIFALKRKGEAATLIRVEGSIQVPKNGTPVEVSLKSGRTAVNGDGDVKVECLIHDEGLDTTVYNRYDWQCRITVPGGGLVGRTDDLTFTAPAEGYQAYDVLDMPKTAKQWRPQMTKLYFVKLKNGSYARLQVRMVTGASNFMRIESYLNPQPGSLNLEYDSTKYTSP